MDKGINTEYSLQSKKILFIAFDFYKYNVAIKEQMEAMGAEVDMFDQVRYSTTFSLLSKVKLGRWYNQQLKHDILDACKRNSYDYIVVIEIKHEFSFYEEIRKLQPTAKYVLYNWDSLNFFDYRQFIPLFDKVYSFDIQDCQNDNHIEYLPLFYTDEFIDARNDKGEKKYDLLYIASFSEEKYNKVQKFLYDYKIPKESLYLYLKVTPLKYLSFLLKGKQFDGLHCKALSRKDISELYKTAKCVIDFGMTYQTGLSMRTFETLGAHKKLITTNAYIKDDEVYCSDNICITTLSNCAELKEFITKDYNTHCTINNYSIGEWVKNLIK